MARLQEAGFAASFALKSLHDLGMNAERVARFVGNHPADAWVVSAGSREVLEWFAGQPVPAIAMYGRFSGLSIAAASPRKIPAMLTGVRKLTELGHHRIVMLAREERRKPNPGLSEQTFLNELATQGLQTGAYNLPDWNDTPAALLACLHSLFQHTPPTALIIGDAPLFVPVQQFLARRGIPVPEQVSLFSLDPDPAYAWCDPVITHVRWDYRPVVRRVLRWADNVAQGQDDRRQTLFEAEFVEGGTIGAAK
jgi:DNA-binding LacI/PurR family transcriptional regulator